MKAISGTLVIAGMALILIALVIFMGPRFGRPFTIWEENWAMATAPYATHYVGGSTRWCGTWLAPHINVALYSTPEQIDAFNKYGAKANLYITADCCPGNPRAQWNITPEMFTAYDPGVSNVNPNLIVAQVTSGFSSSAEGNCRFNWDITFNQAPLAICTAGYFCTTATSSAYRSTDCSISASTSCYQSCSDQTGQCVQQDIPSPSVEPPPPTEQPMPPDNSGIIAVIIILIFVLGIVYLKVR